MCILIVAMNQTAMQYMETQTCRHYMIHTTKPPANESQFFSSLGLTIGMVASGTRHFDPSLFLCFRYLLFALLSSGFFHGFFPLLNQQ